MKSGRMAIAVFAALVCSGRADDLMQQYEKAYFLETAKGQTEEALRIYRQLAVTKATVENRTVILKALDRLQYHYNFPQSLDFEIGKSSLRDGDSIEIENIRGATDELQVGHKYLVKGRYTLKSRDSANLSLFVTATEESKGRTGIFADQQVRVEKGEGAFELSLTLPYKGWPHVSFYPAEGGNGFGGVYFGSGEWLLKEIPGDNQSSTLQAKVDSFDMKRGTLDDVTRVFGEPNHYVFGEERFNRDNLPDVYVMLFPDKFTILMNNHRVEEFRFEGSKAYKTGGIQVGVSLDETLEILGKPKKTIRSDRIEWQEDVLYKTTGGKWKGMSYLAKNGLRLFFKQDVLFALYVTDNTAQHN